MAEPEDPMDFLKRMSTPRGSRSLTRSHPELDKLTTFERGLVKSHYHTCAICGKKKKGGRCPTCTGNPPKRKELASAARVPVFQFAPDARRYNGERMTYPM